VVRGGGVRDTRAARAAPKREAVDAVLGKFRRRRPQQCRAQVAVVIGARFAFSRCHGLSPNVVDVA
jgi:hypothetical protein